MKKLLSTTIIVLAGLIVFLFVGCSTLMDVVTPCYIPPELAETIDEPLTTWPIPYTSVFDAERILRKLHYWAEGLNISIAGAREFQQNVFNPTGPLSFLMIGGPLFAAGAYGVSKPKDRKRIVELEKNGTV